MKSIRIDRHRRLREQPDIGHNRWHPDIPPAMKVGKDELITVETRDARDGQIRHGTTVDDLARQDKKSGHPLTGPIFIEGAAPGDLLEIEYVDIVPQAYGWTRFHPNSGFLFDLFPHSYLVHWDIDGGWARSAQIRGVAIPDGCFVGVSGVAPSHAQLKEWSAREAAIAAKDRRVNLPDRLDAVPATEPIASQGLRTTPPRENGGNLDAKQLTRGSKLLLPVNVDGALYSLGDVHFAQGDGECCVSAIEIGATVTLRFKLHVGEAARRGIVWPRLVCPGRAAGVLELGGYTATVGFPVGDGAEVGSFNLAARNALIEMIQLLQERGFSRDQAYIICSVAVDLRITNAVNFPNVGVSAFLPEAIFRD
jgi:formamidase